VRRSRGIVTKSQRRQGLVLGVLVVMVAWAAALGMAIELGRAAMMW